LARRGFIGLVEKPDPVERGVDVADKGEELEVEGDLTLHLAELVGVARPHEAPVRVPAALAGAHEQVRPPERLLQLLHGRPRLRLPHRLRVLQPPEQRAYHLHPPRQLPAGGAVPAHHARRLGDHRDEAGGVEPHQLRHRGDLPDQSHLLAFGFALVVVGMDEQRIKDGGGEEEDGAVEREHIKGCDLGVADKSKILTCVKETTPLENVLFFWGIVMLTFLTKTYRCRQAWRWPGFQEASPQVYLYKICMIQI